MYRYFIYAQLRNFMLLFIFTYPLNINKLIIHNDESYNTLKLTSKH